ncbi:MAG: hypothetical protein QXF26_04555 [Candidatus Bathyarchaeia archaeon]
MAILTFLILMSGSTLKVSASPSELSYDDGSSEYGWSDFYPVAAAVRFSPPSTNWVLKAVKLHGSCFFKGVSANFYLQIWDEDLNSEYCLKLPFSSVFKRNATLDWYTIELPNVVVSGDFYVVVAPMFTFDSPQLWISVDESAPVSNMSFIVDVKSHIILATLDAASSRPRDFMVRVVGEPTSPPPELKLTSIEFGENETVVRFSFPREIKSASAWLMRTDGIVVEQGVEINDSSLLVRTSEQGVLNIYVVTTASELIGTSMRLNTELRALYKDLLTNYTIIEGKAEEMRRSMSSLSEENEKLRIQVRDSGYAINVLQNQVRELMDNLTEQRQQISELTGSLEKLEMENRTLLSLLIIAVTVPLAILLVKKVRVKR